MSGNSSKQSTYFGVKGERVSVEAGLDGARALLLVLQVVGAAGAVAVVAELPVREAITVAAEEDKGNV